MRIPLLIRYPRLIKSARTSDPFALRIDLAPTVIDLARAEPLQQMDGRSLVPLLNASPPDDWRSSFLIEYNTDTVFPRVRNMGYKAIRTKRWKYIRYNELDGMDELYDLQNDPYEMENVIDHPSSQTVRMQLDAELTP